MRMAGFRDRARTRSFLYSLARFLGDHQAVKRGRAPQAHRLLLLADMIFLYCAIPELSAALWDCRARQARTAPTRVEQMTIHFYNHDTMCPSRIFNLDIDTHPVESGDPVFASLCELDSSGRPFMGGATMRIYNVVPEHDRIKVRGEIDFDRMLHIRVALMWQDAQ
jgi:hypothetical protein